MKTTAVRVELWVQAAPKGPTETQTQGLCWGELRERERERVDRTTDGREDCEIGIPQQIWNTAVESSGVGKTAGCSQADSTEAIQEITDPEATRARAESGRRANKPPRQPGQRPVPLPTHKLDDLVTPRRHGCTTQRHHTISISFLLLAFILCSRAFMRNVKHVEIPQSSLVKAKNLLCRIWHSAT